MAALQGLHLGPQNNTLYGGVEKGFPVTLNDRGSQGCVEAVNLRNEEDYLVAGNPAPNL